MDNWYFKVGAGIFGAVMALVFVGMMVTMPPVGKVIVGAMVLGTALMMIGILKEDRK